MNRTQRLKINSIASLINRAAILLSGLIIPRLILLHYGSEVNGLVASITQFLSVITFLDLGVGSVVQSQLYKPLASRDMEQISKILVAARTYFQKISVVIIGYVIILILTYPVLINGPEFSYYNTIMLIIAIFINIFSQYFAGIVNELLLNADQRGYVQLSTETILVIINLLISILLIKSGTSIQFVKLSSGLIYLVRPLILSLYVNKNYKIDYNIEKEENSLPQMWNGLWHHLAYTIQNSSSIIVLTVFSTLENVSIYSIYNMVVNSISLVISAFTTSLSSFFGNVIAKETEETLNTYFSKIEWGLHTLVTYLYGMTAVLIIPFVKVYTSGVTDISYHAPVFAIILVISKALFSLRTPYQTVVFSAGHFKQTQISSVIEASVSIIISIILVNYLGLIGVALASLAAMVYRIVYLILYLSKNILHRPIKIFIKQFLIDTLIFSLFYIVGAVFATLLEISSITQWFIIAIILGIIFFFITILVNYLFYKNMIIYLYNQIMKK